MATSSGAGELANVLLPLLTEGKNFEVPEIDLSDDMFQQPAEDGPIYGEVSPITFEELTTGQVGGTGVFDRLMVSLVNHLKVEYQANRISGAEYTKAYIGIVQAALQTAQQFLLTKDQAYWQALLVQAQAKAAEVATTQARVELETARVMLVRTQFEALTAEVNYGLTKIKISSEDATFANLIKQGTSLDYTNDRMYPQQLALLKEQTETQRSNTLDTRTDGAAITGTAGKQKEQISEQIKLIKEQTETQRSQTLDTRTDNITVTGSVGKQKALYDQQITSYQRDSEQKAAKMWVDAWITQKTIDEGLIAPNQFTNANLDALLTSLRSKLNLG
nr:MAG TPA: hypothetical protein [Caudoviricetes sp.]